jgi:hypothetical protein
MRDQDDSHPFKNLLICMYLELFLKHELIPREGAQMSNKISSYAESNDYR